MPCSARRRPRDSATRSRRTARSERSSPARSAPLTGTKAATTDPSTVQTITGATISSRAVIKIINDAVALWQPRLAAFDAGGHQVTAPTEPVSDRANRFVPGAPPPATLWRGPLERHRPRQPGAGADARPVPDDGRQQQPGQRRRHGHRHHSSCSSARASSSRCSGSTSPNEVRLTSYILIIATFVTVADLTLAADLPGHLQGARAVRPADRGQLHHPRPRRGVRRQGGAGARRGRRASAWGSASRSRCRCLSAFRELLGSGSLLGHRHPRPALRAVGVHGDAAGRLPDPRHRCFLDHGMATARARPGAPRRRRHEQPGLDLPLDAARQQLHAGDVPRALLLLRRDREDRDRLAARRSPTPSCCSSPRSAPGS